MQFRSKAVICVAMLLGATVAASAASKKAKDEPSTGTLRNQVTLPQPPVNSDDPALTGGGSLGYNQNIYNSW